MKLELILSNKELDVWKQSTSYQPRKSIIRSTDTDDNCVYVEFGFGDHPGRNLPHVRASLNLEDAMEIIDALVKKGDPDALRVQNAHKLAVAIADFAKNSN